jgi:hypothetical protein
MNDLIVRAEIEHQKHMGSSPENTLKPAPSLPFYFRSAAKIQQQIVVTRYSSKRMHPAPSEIRLHWTEASRFSTEHLTALP